MDRIFTCILTQLERIEEKVDNLTQMLDENTKILDEHGKILDEHGRILNNLEKNTKNCDRTDVNACDRNGETPKTAEAVFNRGEKFENGASAQHSSDEGDLSLLLESKTLFSKAKLLQSDESHENSGASKDISPETSTQEKPQPSLLENVKLEEAESTGKSSKSAENIQTEELYKNARTLLNRLTFENLPATLNRIKKLPINTPERLAGFIDLLVRKAFTSPDLSKSYAILSKMLCSGSFVMNSKENLDINQTNFRRVLLNSCQSAFELHAGKLEKSDSRLNEEDQLKLVNITRFIGELFKLDMLKTSIMHSCITYLLKRQHEEELESLCDLLTVVGKHYESRLENRSQGLDPIMEELKKLTVTRREKNARQISPRIKEMIQAVLKLRQNNWQRERWLPE